MPKKLVTEEFLKTFGPGDQFHLFYPETGGRIVADVTAIRLLPRPENNDQELFVELNGAIEFGEVWEDGARPRPELGFYNDVLISDLFVAKEELGYAEIPNVPGEQILLLVKPSHRLFMHRVEAPVPRV